MQLFRPLHAALMALAFTIVSSAASAASYTIVDLGAPAASTYSGSTPVGMNNTGQIVGVANPIAKAGVQDCIVWNGTAFVDISPSNSNENCTPSPSLSDAATGKFAAVGYVGDPIKNVSRAFYANIAQKTTFKVFRSRNGSQFLWITKTGVALGYSLRKRIGTYPLFDPIRSTGQRPALIQPQCRTIHLYCLGTAYPAARYLSTSGIVFGGDDFSGKIMELTIGKHGSEVDLPVLSPPAGGFVGIDDRGNVGYRAMNSSYLYILATHTATDLGSLPGSGCNAYWLGAINGAGEILGTAFGGCTKKSRIYWTWDGVRGMLSLDAQLPPNAYVNIVPLAMNDHGQILAQLTTATGEAHWGILSPPKAR